MSYSVQSTKRKFTRLLDAISNGGAAGPSECTSQRNDTSERDTTAEIIATRDGAIGNGPRPIKRRRPSPLPQRSAAVSANPQLSSLLNQFTASRKSSANTTSSTRSRRMADNHAAELMVPGSTVRRGAAHLWSPDNKLAYLQRLSTYEVINWYGKHPRVDAPEFAKWGWGCVDEETVECVSCRARFVVWIRGDDPRDSGEKETETPAWEWDAQRLIHYEMTDEFAAKTEVRMEEEHDEDCLWRIRHCGDWIQSISVWPPSRFVGEFRARYLAIKGYAAVLPPNLVLPEGLESGPNDLHALWAAFSIQSQGSGALVENAASSQLGNADFMTLAFALAMLGWDIESEDRGEEPLDACLRCNECLTRTGLFFYNPRDGGAKPPVYAKFQAMETHKEWCPWINAETQHRRSAERFEHPGEAKAAWEILATFIKTQSGSLGTHNTSTSRSTFAVTVNNNIDNIAVQQPVATTTEQEPETGQQSHIDSSQTFASLFAPLSAQHRAVEQEQREETREQQLHPTTSGSAISEKTQKLNDEERKKKHKSSMAWLSKLSVKFAGNKKGGKFRGE